MNTTELVRQAQAGCGQAMQQLLCSWRPRLVRYACRIAGDEARAQDIAQETLLRVFRNIGSLANPEAFSSWIYVVLRRVSIELARRETRQAHDAISLDDAWLTPVALRHYQETHEQLELRQCLSRLRRNDRQLLELHYWGGHELREIAPMLHIDSAGAAKTRLFRVRRQVRELYGAM